MTKEPNDNVPDTKRGAREAAAHHDGLETGHATPEGEAMTAHGSISSDEHAVGSGEHEGLELAEARDAGRKMSARGSAEPDDGDDRPD